MDQQDAEKEKMESFPGDVMRELIPLQKNIRKKEVKQLEILGVNYTDNYREGQLAYSDGISTRRYPYIANRFSNERLPEYSNVDAMGAWDTLVYASGGKLYYKGEEVGEISEGPKQFVFLNTKIVIWPDKMYIDMLEGKAYKIEDSYTSWGIHFNGTRVYLYAFTQEERDERDAAMEKFKVGDCLTITGDIDPENVEEDGLIVTEINKRLYYISFAREKVFKANNPESSKIITIARHVPPIDYICESENRLWGCSNKDQTIYASALGDPGTFYDYRLVSTASFAIAVGSKGDFTGCAHLGSTVLFFKEDCMHKMLGSYPEEYQMVTYNYDGVKRGCNKSIVGDNEVLYFVGTNGVYQYNGATPYLISRELGNISLENAIGGFDGQMYHISAEVNGETQYLTYDTVNRIWMRESGNKVVDFAKIDDIMYTLLDDGYVYKKDLSGRYEGEWRMRLKPIYESGRSSKGSAATFEKKRYSRLLIRVELPEGSRIIADVSTDGGKWKKCGEIRGEKENVSLLVVPIARCDKFELELHGTGEFTILGISRSFMEGSAR